MPIRAVGPPRPIGLKKDKICKDHRNLCGLIDLLLCADGLSTCPPTRIGTVLGRSALVERAMPKLGSDASHSLPALQNLIKRDPASYADEFRRRWHHFQSVLALHQQNPAADSRELVTSVAFAAAVGPCYPELTVSLPSQLSALLEEQHSALDSTLRSALLQALILLRNRGMMAALELLQLCFRLFRCRDKALRAKVTAHIVADLKLVNLKRKDMALNKALQNYVITMLSDANAAAAKHSLMVMIQMYRRGIWRDAKTVNVVAGALFSPHTKLRVAALHFLLGAHDLAADAADSDEEEESARKGQRVAALRETIGKDGSSTKSLKCKKKRALKRASRSAAKASSKSSAGANANGAFAAIHLLHNPHDVAERLVSELRKSKDRFEVRARRACSIAHPTLTRLGLGGLGHPVPLPVASAGCQESEEAVVAWRARAAINGALPVGASRVNGPFRWRWARASHALEKRGSSPSLSVALSRTLSHSLALSRTLSHSLALSRSLVLSVARSRAVPPTPRRASSTAQVRLLMISLSSRLIGTHRLMLPAFYPFVMRYMQPHQRDVTTILAACVQAAHELVPPETLEPVLQTLVTHFVSDRSRPEVGKMEAGRALGRGG